MSGVIWSDTERWFASECGESKGNFNHFGYKHQNDVNKVCILTIPLVKKGMWEHCSDFALTVCVCLCACARVWACTRVSVLVLCERVCAPMRMETWHWIGEWHLKAYDEWTALQCKSAECSPFHQINAFDLHLWHVNWIGPEFNWISIWEDLNAVYFFSQFLFFFNTITINQSCVVVI